MFVVVSLWFYLSVIAGAGVLLAFGCGVGLGFGLIVGVAGLVSVDDCFLCLCLPMSYLVLLFAVIG